MKYYYLALRTACIFVYNIFQMILFDTFIELAGRWRLGSDNREELLLKKPTTLHCKWKMTTNLVQYVVLRSDLSRVLQWPLGALIAQAAHASTAVTHIFYEDANTKAYLADLDRMHKVVLEVNLVLKIISRDNTKYLKYLGSR